ncbi:MAG: hypothetical protein K6U89_18545, partial [Chloroflexi bacterium]|nr:hypothetical protein [Chloroflexota bacterium]
MSRSFELLGLDGTNPLGFLAALGTLVSLEQACVGEPRLRWKRATRWTPILENVHVKDEDELARKVADSLRGGPVPADVERRRLDAQKEMEDAQKEMERVKKTIEKKNDEIKKRRLRGRERTEAEERELRPLRREYAEKRSQWLEALRVAVPRPELALGKRIEDCTSGEYREFAAELIRTAGGSDRESVDMLAAFGTDAVCRRKPDSIEPTPFSFASGSGKQFFLETARKLLDKVDTDRVRRTLFESWDYQDQRLSMRWDPIEDRRYALMDRDPTAPGNEPRTMWMANLLAYRGLALFPSVPMGRRLQTAGWDEKQASFTWPLWVYPVSMDVVRSLLQLRELVEGRPN